MAIIHESQWHLPDEIKLHKIKVAALLPGIVELVRNYLEQEKVVDFLHWDKCTTDKNSMLAPYSTPAIYPLT